MSRCLYLNTQEVTYEICGISHRISSQKYAILKRIFPGTLSLPQPGLRDQKMKQTFNHKKMEGYNRNEHGKDKKNPAVRKNF